MFSFLACVVVVGVLAGCSGSSKQAEESLAPARLDEAPPGITDERSTNHSSGKPGSRSSETTKKAGSEPWVARGPGRVSTPDTSKLLEANPDIYCEFANSVSSNRERWAGLGEIPIVVGDDRSLLFPDAKGSVDVRARSGGVRTARVDSLTPRRLWRAADIPAEYIGVFTILDRAIPPYIVIRPSTLIAREKYATGELVSHEIGHAVGYSIIESRSPGSTRSNALSRKAHRQLLADYGITANDAAQVSAYATSSPTEAFAEIYMAFFNRTNEIDRSLSGRFETLLSTELPQHALVPRFVRLRPDKPLVCSPP